MRCLHSLIVFALLVLPSLARGQEFSRVVIRASASTGPSESRLKILASGDLTGHSIPIVDLIKLAYDVPDNPSPRLAWLPEWTIRQRFDIEAKTPVSLKLDSMDIQTQRRTIALLIQKLLVNRLGLTLKVKTERTPVYALSVIGKNAKLARSTVYSSHCILDTSSAGCHSFEPGFGHPLNARAVDMADLALYLENWTDLPVVDRTAKTGLFAMHSQGWKPMKLPPPPPGALASGNEFASLATLPVVLSSFGLRLSRREETLPFYTVEQIHQPHEK